MGLINLVFYSALKESDPNQLDTRIRTASVVWSLLHIKNFLSSRSFDIYLGLKMCFRPYFLILHQNYICCVCGKSVTEG